MKNLSCILLIVFFVLAIGCREKMEENEILQIGIKTCQRQPEFISNTGLNTNRCAFSTSEKHTKGLAMVQIPENAADTTGRKIWQHPSWNKYGYMGAITTDENGNAYTISVPLINVLDNPLEKQNIIYKVSGTDGEMKPLVADLPMEVKPGNPNCFGMTGLYYDCHAKQLYAATVAGSTRYEENGIIYLIDPITGKVMDKLTGRDALGLCVGGITGEKRLYFGSSRTSDICSVELTNNGRFIGKVKQEFSIDMLGPRGDDKARRIRFDKDGNMILFGVEFNYNLTAPTEKQETIYRFRYEEEEKKWVQAQ